MVWGLQGLKKPVFWNAGLDLGSLPGQSSSADRGNTLFRAVLQQWCVEWNGSATQGEFGAPLNRHGVW